MVIGLLKWIFKHFAPYVAGILVGVGFFFLLIRLLPMLPDAPVLDWPMGDANKEVSLPLPTETTQAVAPIPAPIPPSEAKAEERAPVVPPEARQVPPVADAVLPGRGVEVADMPAAMATEQPIGAELDSDPVEKLSAAVPPAKPVEQQKSSAQQVAQSDCGTPPMRPGRSMDQYLACQWRADCLNRLGRARSMIEQDKRRCPATGNEAQSCLAYYRSLEMQYHPSLCGGWSAMPGRW